MNQNNIATVESYYRAMCEKNIAGMDRYLHQDVKFTSPLAEMAGKESVLKSAQGLMVALNTITIRAKFGSGDQVMLAYDFHFLPPVGILRSAGLFTVQDGLITKIELFFDGRPFA